MSITISLQEDCIDIAVADEDVKRTWLNLYEEPLAFINQIEAEPVDGKEVWHCIVIDPPGAKHLIAELQKWIDAQ